MLRAPNIALFVISGCLAILGILAALPISLPIPGLTGNSSWYIFAAWFLLAANTAMPPASGMKTDEQKSRAVAGTGRS
jgi:hypothetical protein